MSVKAPLIYTLYVTHMPLWSDVTIKRRLALFNVVNLMRVHTNYLPLCNLHVFPLLVPSPPIGLKAFSITSVSMTLSWQTPRDLNGIIRGYQVSYTPHGESECLHDVDGDTTSTELTYLKPHTEYTLLVRAKTVDYGDYSSLVIVSTKEDGE